MADREPNPDPAAAHGQPSPEAHVQLRFEKFSSFVEEYWPKISLRGMLLETTQPKPVGTMISFEFKLTDGFRLCQGVGEVAWVRRRDEGPQGPAGMGIRFHALDDQGRELILKILEEQVKSGGEPFEIERVPPGAESEPAPPAPRESAEPEPPAAEQGWVRPPPREVERKQPPPTEPLEPAAAAAAPADGGFQAPWEKLPEPSDVLDPLDDSSVSAEAEMEVDSDSALAGFPRGGTNGGFPRRGTNGGFPRRGTNGGFPLDPDSSETELQEADDEPLLLFAADETEEGEALPIDETVAERVEFDPFGGEASEPALSFDLDEPSPELEAPIELAGEELAPADWPDVSGEEPTILLSKIDDLAGEDRPPSLEADAEIQFDAESSAVFLDLDTSAEELTTPLLRDAGGAVQEVLEEAAAIPEFDGIGGDAPDVLGSRPDDEPAEGPAVSPEPESPQLAEIEVAPEAESLPPFAEIEAAPEPESPPPFAEIEAAPEPESPPPFAEIEVAPEPESPPPFAEIEAAPEPESPPPFPDVEVPPEAESPPLFPDVEVPPEAGSAESPLPFAEIEVAPEPSASPAPEEA
ncbi:MAG: hypothetical protein GY856_17995, partial [bacterium]|nr:hypothetical protein [bacterium]